MASPRDDYLRALGVQRWVRRNRPAEPRPADDVAIGEGAPQAEEASVSPPAEVSAAPAPAPEAVAMPPAKRSAASSPTSLANLGWAELRERVASCRLCALCDGRTQTVFGTGATDANWLIVGEAPGAEEDRQGEPFVGRAGMLLNAMLKAAGRERQSVYIANILKCRPPQNRDPKSDEAASCRPYLDRQIELLQPQLIIAVGRIAAHRLLGTDAPLGRLRGRVHHYGETSPIPLVVTYHPAYLLRSPGQKRKAWEDLLFAHSVAGGKVH